MDPLPFHDLSSNMGVAQQHDGANNGLAMNMPSTLGMAQNSMGWQNGACAQQTFGHMQPMNAFSIPPGAVEAFDNSAQY